MPLVGIPRGSTPTQKQNTAAHNARMFTMLLTSEGLPMPEAEYRFHVTRKWRFDFAWPEYKVALEVEGGVWAKGGGGHNRPTYFLKNIEKYNEATASGWLLLRCVPKDLLKTATVDMVKRAMKARPVNNIIELKVEGDPLFVSERRKGVRGMR